jgi:hypothetical protein
VKANDGNFRESKSFPESRPAKTQFQESAMNSLQKLDEVECCSTDSTAQFFSRKARLRSPLLVLLAATVALAIAPRAKAAPAFLANRKLMNNYFATNVGVNAACAPAGCLSAPIPLFVPPALPIVCPGGVGATCTFYIHLETDDGLTIGDQGIFQFLVAGVPVPGPTFAGGMFLWDNNDPNSALAVPFSHSYAVTAAVTNTAVNQAWPVTVSLMCADNAGTPAGCSATTFLANLEVHVYRP